MLIVIEIEEMVVALNNMWRESKEIEGDFHPILMELERVVDYFWLSSSHEIYI